MPILLNSIVFIAGVLKGPSDGTLTLGAALESDLVNRRVAVYVGGNPAAGGLVAAYSTTDANGNKVLAESDGSLYATPSRRNLVINGSFAVNDREYVSGAATTAGQYTLDRWKVTGTGGITFSTVENITTVTIPAGQGFQQVVDGVNLRSGTHVLTWGGTAQAKIGAGALSASGVTGVVTGGTNVTLEFGPGTVSDVQFERSSIATPYEYVPAGTERLRCQEYYWRIAGGNEVLMGHAYSTTLALVPLRYPVRMRGIPAFSISGSILWERTGGSVAITGVGFTGATVNAARMDLTATTVTAGDAGAVLLTASTDYIQASAEL